VEKYYEIRKDYVYECEDLIVYGKKVNSSLVFRYYLPGLPLALRDLDSLQIRDTYKDHLPVVLMENGDQYSLASQLLSKPYDLRDFELHSVLSRRQAQKDSVKIELDEFLR
jgi:hypothetical protein